MAGSPDVVVVGAGVFGAWTAYQLRSSGRSVVLLDAFGPGSSRTSSGGESRVIRIGYGDKELYSRWAIASLERWQTLFSEARRPLFVRTGVLWLGRQDDPLIDRTADTLARLGVDAESLSRDELQHRFPQFALGSVIRGVLERNSGVLLARRAVDTVVRQAIRRGVDYRLAAVDPPEPDRRLNLDAVRLANGDRLQADAFVFACGPWLSRLFPRVLSPLMRTTRQEVFFFGGAPGDQRFRPPAMPAWVDFQAGVYGLPDIEGRGAKIGLDAHGPPFDPDLGDRLPSPSALLTARRLTAERLPALRDARLLEAKVCQYTNTSNGDFLLDRHPEQDNVWIAGGGSGHGFKHGPAVGAYLTSQINGTGEAEPCFTFARKGQKSAREVF